MAELARQLLLATLLLWQCGSTEAAESSKFFTGGSMSYSFSNQTNDMITLHVTVITGWILGLGPCGPSCSTNSVGMDTRASRQQRVTDTGNPEIFGNWSMEMNKKHHTEYASLNSAVTSTLQEQVAAVNEALKWEQEVGTFIVSINTTWDYTDIMVEGLAWRGLNYGGLGVYYELPYHQQIKVVAKIRSDTGEPNNSPSIMFKPIYQLLLNHVTYIRLSTMDPDGDAVKCAEAHFVDAGGIRPIDGVTVFSNCTIAIDTNDPSFEDGGWGAIALKVSDYNRNLIKMGDTTFPAGLRPVSDIPLQFVFQTLRTLDIPEFVDPTLPSQHTFEVYEGANLEILLYAKPSSRSLSNVKAFYVTSIPRKNFVLSPIRPDVSRSAERVVTSHLTWQTQSGDVGFYLLQARVVDEDGKEAEERNYVVYIKNFTAKHDTSPGNGIPYFLRFPDDSTVMCLQAVTCSIPVYAAVEPSEPVTITLDDTSSLRAGVTLGPTTETTINDTLGATVTSWKADLVVVSELLGNRTFCLKASTSTHHAVKCFFMEVTPQDPCHGLPCENRGTCEPNGADFSCHCSPSFTGNLCETSHDFCRINPCPYNGICTPSDLLPPKYRICTCPGYEGADCQTDVDECKSNPCANGRCEDKVNSFVCHCDPGFQGVTCREGTCASNICLNGGQCVVDNGNPICRCPLSFTGTKCETGVSSGGPPGINDRDPTEPGFTQPSPQTGTHVSCPLNTDCNIPLTFKGPAGATLVAGPVTWGVNASVTSALTSGQMHEGKLTVTPTSPGPLRVCVNLHDPAGSDDDHICYTIDTPKDSPSTSSGQQFTKDTLPTKSKIVCLDNQPCHTVVTTTKNPSGKCDQVTTDADNVTVFQTKVEGDHCSTDVLLRPDPEVKDACLVAGNGGEQRCYDATKVRHDNGECQLLRCQHDGQCMVIANASSPTTVTAICVCQLGYSDADCSKVDPCSSFPCQNEGACSAPPGQMSFICVCPVGFSGPNCEQSQNQAITKAEIVSPTMADGSSLSCTVDEACVFPVFVRKGSGAIPLLVSDAHSPELSVNLRPLKPDPSVAGVADLHSCQMAVTPHVPGTLQLCLHLDDDPTPSAQRHSALCINVESKSSGTRYTGGVDFERPTSSDNTTLTCKAGETCHMLVYTPTTKEGTCDERNPVWALEPLSQHVKLTVFAGKLSPRHPLQCITDVAFTPETTGPGKPYFCLKATYGGAVRCFNVSVPKSRDPCASHPPCQHGLCAVSSDGTTAKCVCNVGWTGQRCDSKICQNGGVFKYNVRDKTSTCTCPLGKEGQYCEKDQTVSKPTFAEELLPGSSTLRCFKNIPCDIPITGITSDPNHPPAVTVRGHSPNIAATVGPSSKTAGVSGNYFTATATLTAKSTGTQQVCFELQANTPDGKSVCYHVDVTDNPFAPHLPTAEPHFVSPSPQPGGTFFCPKDKECHVLVYSTPDGNNKCQPVIATDGDATAFPTSLHDGKCVTDVAFTPDPYRVTSRLCLQPGNAGDQRCYSVSSIASIESTYANCYYFNCN